MNDATPGPHVGNEAKPKMPYATSPAYHACPRCGGSGIVPSGPIVTTHGVWLAYCSLCDGRGYRLARATEA